MLHEGEGELVCCGAPMKLFQENTVDAAKEKHIPVIEKIEDGFKVKVGSVIILNGLGQLQMMAGYIASFSIPKKHRMPSSESRRAK